MSQLKGVIMAAGYGTRFFPITKSIPKEMLPIVNTPAIDFILDEFENAGIKDVVIITQRKKKALEDYLDIDPELTSFLEQKNNEEQKKLIRPRANMQFSFVRQQEMKGTGDALLLVENVVGNSSFILAYPDDITISEKSVSLQMQEIFHQYPEKKAILACEELEGDVSRFGVIKKGALLSPCVYEVQGMVEKPEIGKEPSKIISIGRYLLTPDIFSVLHQVKKNPRKGEFFLTEALKVLISQHSCLSYNYEGYRLDIGEPDSYVQSIIKYIKSHPQYREYL